MTIAANQVDMSCEATQTLQSLDEKGVERADKSAPLKSATRFNPKQQLGVVVSHRVQYKGGHR